MDGRPIDSESAAPGDNGLLTLARFGYDPFVGAIAHPKGRRFTPRDGDDAAPMVLDPKHYKNDKDMESTPEAMRHRNSAAKTYPQTEGDSDVTGWGPHSRTPSRHGIIGRKHHESGGIVGAASTYNPFKPGWKSGGPHTSSGERYDPSKPTAAIRTDLRNRFGGARPGHIGYADVEYQGKKIRVRVNDVGPLTGGRIIDLNEAAMKFFDPSMKKGVLHGVKVTPVGAESRQGTPKATNKVGGETNKAGGIRVLPSSAMPTRETNKAGGIRVLPSSSSAMPTSGTGNVSGMQPHFRERLNQLYSAMPENLRHGTSVFSGYRSPKHQARLFARSDHSGHMVARHSRHTMGIAADLRFGSPEAKRWVHQHAHEHGLHFPMPYEPWHIEPSSGPGSRGSVR